MGSEAESPDVTIYDVARVAGVSPSTVSRTFSRPGRVSTATAERIRQVATEIGYHPREVVPPPSKAATKVLGLSVADITNPFNFRLIRGAQAAAAEAGFVMTLTDSQESDQLEREMLRRSLPLLDGLVLASSRLTDAECRAFAKQLPTVMVNRRVAGVHSVVTDMVSGMRLAAEHLVAQGHRNITYVAGPEVSWADGMRYKALRDAARELGVTEQRIGPVVPTIQGGRSAVEALIGRRAKAVIAYNDLVAIGLLKGLQERGVVVPRDLSLVGFDNNFAAALVEPGLTTVAAPLTQLGEAAVRHITAVLNGEVGEDAVASVLPVRLMIRDSVAPPA